MAVLQGVFCRGPQDGPDVQFVQAGQRTVGMNRTAAYGEVKVSPELFEIMQIAQKTAEMSGGKYDITIGPVVLLWGFAGPRRYTPPSDEEFKKARSLVNYKNLILNEQTHTVRLAKPGMVVDLGSLGKGYAIDLVAEI